MTGSATIMDLIVCHIDRYGSRRACRRIMTGNTVTVAFHPQGMVNVYMVDKVGAMASTTVTATIIAGRSTSRHGNSQTVCSLQYAAGLMAGGARVMDLIIGNTQGHATAATRSGCMTGVTATINCHEPSMIPAICRTAVTCGTAATLCIYRVMVYRPFGVGDGIMADSTGNAKHGTYG